MAPGRIGTNCAMRLLIECRLLGRTNWGLSMSHRQENWLAETDNKTERMRIQSAHDRNAIFLCFVLHVCGWSYWLFVEPADIWYLHVLFLAGQQIYRSDQRMGTMAMVCPRDYLSFLFFTLRTVEFLIFGYHWKVRLKLSYSMDELCLIRHRTERLRCAYRKIMLIVKLHCN